MGNTADEMLESRFIQGFAYAVANLNRLHDEPGMCRHLLMESGYTLRDFACVDEYDRDEIRKIWISERITWRQRARSLSVRFVKRSGSA